MYISYVFAVNGNLSVCLLFFCIFFYAVCCRRRCTIRHQSLNLYICYHIQRVYMCVCCVCTNGSSAIQMSAEADARWDLFSLCVSLSLASSCLDVCSRYRCVHVFFITIILCYFTFLFSFLSLALCFFSILLNSIGSYFSPVHLLHSENGQRMRMILCDCILESSSDSFSLSFFLGSFVFL